MNYSLILATDKNGVIAIDGKIPWICNEKYKADLAYFRATTTDHVTIMGAATYESIPNRKLLSNRINIVISNRENIIKEVTEKGGLTFPSVLSLHKYLLKNYSKLPCKTDEFFVIGGINLYNSMKHLISKFYITVIPEEYPLNSNRKIFTDHWDIIKKIKPIEGVNNMKFYTFNILREDQKYKNLMSSILCANNKINAEFDRTGYGYYVSYGEMLKFNIYNGVLPMTTLREQPFRWIVEELLWFIRGETDNKILKDKKINIWQKNTTQEFIKNRNLPYPEDIAGPIYGWQWRRFGAEYNSEEKGVDQLYNIIKDIHNKSTRYGRRHIISAWNPCDIDKMVLPPCHVLYQFNVDPTDHIHTTFYQRSSDVAVACSWNVASATILTNIIAALSGTKTGTITMFISNAHIYNNHMDQVKEMISRQPYDFPTLELVGVNESNDDEICTKLDNLSFDNFKIANYYAHPKLQLDMNA
jgi:thymidylate synthase